MYVAPSGCMVIVTAFNDDQRRLAPLLRGDMMDEPALRRNQSVAATAENTIPRGKHLYWDREQLRLVSSEYLLPVDGHGNPPPPNELDALLDALWAAAVKRPLLGLVEGVRRFLG